MCRPDYVISLLCVCSVIVELSVDLWGVYVYSAKANGVLCVWCSEWVPRLMVR